jgi:putative FmdB family regulatory protein
MPTYDYRCGACGHELEIFHSMSEAPKRKCPKCGKLKLARRIGTGGGILFKGSGFYQTDYRSDSYRKAEKAESGDGGSSSGSGSKASESAPKKTGSDD